MAKRAAIKAQVGALFRQAVDQLDDVRQVVRRRGDRIETDIKRLMAERDRLLQLLGEQTYKLANQGKFPLPSFVQRTVERLNEVVTSLAPATMNGHDASSDRMDDADVETQATLKKRTAKKARGKKSRASASKSTN